MRTRAAFDRLSCPRDPVTLARVLAAATLLATFASVADAQRSGSGEGYLFQEPTARLSIRGGYTVARAGSDLFADLTDQFILSKRDFNAFSIGAEGGYQVAPRVELSVSVDYAGARSPSEYRRLVDNDDLPIEQTTRFERVPIMGNARISLLPRGRRIGRLAWIPARVVPWVGAGAGAVWYRLQQVGDFVDVGTNEVAFDELGSDGWTFGGQAMAGADVGVTPHVALTVDVRSIWARAALGRDYSGYERLDLSGVNATLGFTYRF